MLPPASDETVLPIAVIGAGPVGLTAALHLIDRGLPAVVLEAGDGPGAAIREWGHVRLFSSWKLCLERLAVERLAAEGWKPPDQEALPRGIDLVEQYLEPLARLPELVDRVRYGHRVTAVTRRGRDRLKGREDRAGSPFRLRIEGPGGTSHLFARAVLDASGTWNQPRPLGADGLPAIGEAQAGDRIRYGLPDVRGRERDRYGGFRTAVVGAGHSAANVLLELARLAEEIPGTEPVWILRGSRPGKFFRDEDEGQDALRARGALEKRLRELVETGRVEAVTGFGTHEIRERDRGVVLMDGEGRTLEADRVVGVTGFRPDLEMLRELRLDLDPMTEAPRELGPMIDPNVHSCRTVPAHGEEVLRHPEPGFYLVGMKSYGRAPTFLLPTGYEQVRSVVAALAGDRDAATRVELRLPETGICSADAALEVEETCRA